ncbi:hypothetical protein Tco_0881063 [Tanacetum coccineum]
MEVLLGLIQAATTMEANDSPGASNAASAYGGGNAAQQRYGSASRQFVGGYRLLEVSTDTLLSDVISFILEQIKVCSFNADGGKNNMLSSLFHVLALILNKVKDAREVASKNGLVDQKLNADISKLLKKEDVGNQNSLVIDDEKQNRSESSLGLSTKHNTKEEHRKFVEISCRYLTRQLPSETIHVVLQLCSTLARTHYVAVKFLDAGGLPLLLSLPTSSVFVWFGDVAATYIQHIL